MVIGPNGSGKAIRNINIVADAGIEKGETRSESFAWFNGGSETRKTQLEVKDGKYTYAHNADNYVRVDQGGWLLAGDKSVIDISITGVKVPEGSISGSYNGYSGQGSYTITALDDEGNHYDDIETGIHTGTMDYANYLNAQWQRVCDLIEAYSRAGHESDPAYAGYLQERAMLEDQMEQLADAFVIVPGGIGTCDEFFQILTLKYLHRIEKPIVLFNVCNFWDNLLAVVGSDIFKGFIAPGIAESFTVCETPTSVLDTIEAAAKKDLE